MRHPFDSDWVHKKLTENLGFWFHNTIYKKEILEKMSNFCKQCGKEISEKQTFCCKSCCATYTNMHRVRKHKVKVVKKIDRFCEHCGVKIVKKGFRRICPECSKYQHYGLYRKLGISTKQPLSEAYSQAYATLKRLYSVENLSVIDIFNKTGVCHRTLKDVFGDFGDSLRTITEGQEIAIQKGKISPRPVKKYKQGWHTTWEGIQVYYRSSYELEFAKKLDSERVSYRMEFPRLFYWDSVKKRRRVAIPDFYLPGTNDIVEVKSSYTYRKQEMKDKFEAYRKLGYKPRLLLEKQFVAVE